MALIDIVREEIGDDENYFYTDKGDLVYREESLSETKHLVNYVYYVNSDYHSEYGSSNVDYGDTIVYCGRLHNNESFVRSQITHESVEQLELRKKKLSEEIAVLNKEVNRLEEFKRANAKDYENNKTFSIAHNLLTNTKRFILVRENSYNFHIVDNLDKRFVDFDKETDEYYNSERRYKDIEFTIYRDFSKYGNVKDKMFNYSIKLDRDRDNSWRDDTKYIPNKFFEVDIEFFDTFEEIQLVADQWVRENKLTPKTYLNLISQCKLKVNPELGEAFKEDLLKNARRIKRDKTEYQKKCSDEIIEASKKLEDLEKIDPTDILTLTRLHGGRL